VPSSLSITPTPHWFNGWFLRLLATPVVRINAASRIDAAGVIERDATWGRATVIDVEPGSHSVSVGARYRGTRAVLGAEQVVIRVDVGQRVHLTAQNGPLNHQPFVVRTAR
jgi:hypothetical protein